MIDRRDPRRRRQIDDLHRLGPYGLLHFVADVEAGADVDKTLERYARLPAEFVAELGGHDIPSQTFVIRGGRP